MGRYVPIQKTRVWAVCLQSYLSSSNSSQYVQQTKLTSKQHPTIPTEILRGGDFRQKVEEKQIDRGMERLTRRDSLSISRDKQKHCLINFTFNWLINGPLIFCHMMLPLHPLTRKMILQGNLQIAQRFHV